MTTRCLTIQVDQTGLLVLAAAGQRIALVKSAADQQCPVVWQAVHPAEQNVVSWDGSYQVYASTTALVPGGSLRVMAATAATGGYTYPFTGGQFGAGASGLPSRQVGLRNLDDQITVDGVPSLTGGVGETAEVDQQPVTSPLDAQAVPYQELAVSMLSELVLVLPASGVEAGTLLDRSWLDGTSAVAARLGIVLGTPLAVDLTTDTDRTIHYSDTDNAFVPGALDQDQATGARRRNHRNRRREEQ